MTERERERERETDRQTDRQTDSDRDRERELSKSTQYTTFWLSKSEQTLFRSHFPHFDVSSKTFTFVWKWA